MPVMTIATNSLWSRSCVFIALAYTQKKLLKNKRKKRRKKLNIPLHNEKKLVHN